jgi:hypothetical protein
VAYTALGENWLLDINLIRPSRLSLVSLSLSLSLSLFANEEQESVRGRKRDGPYEFRKSRLAVESMHCSQRPSMDHFTSRGSREEERSETV